MSEGRDSNDAPNDNKTTPDAKELGKPPQIIEIDALKELIQDLLNRLVMGELFMEHGLEENKLESLLSPESSVSNNGGKRDMTEEFKTFLKVIAQKLKEQGTDGSKKKKKKMLMEALHRKRKEIEKEIRRFIRSRKNGMDDETNGNAQLEQKEHSSQDQIEAESENGSKPNQQTILDGEAGSVSQEKPLPGASDGNSVEDSTPASHKTNKKQKKKKKEKKIKKGESKSKSKSKADEEHEEKVVPQTATENNSSRDQEIVPKHLDAPLSEARLRFEKERDRILTQIPAFVKKRFRQPAFTKWTKTYLPVLEISPFDVEPGPVREQWITMFEKTRAAKRPPTHLVFWYGTTWEARGEAYSFVPKKSLKSLEEGLAMGLDQIPKSIQKKIDKGKELNTMEKFHMDALDQFKADLKLPPEDRIEWMGQFDENYVHEEGYIPGEEPETSPVYEEPDVIPQPPESFSEDNMSVNINEQIISSKATEVVNSENVHKVLTIEEETIEDEAEKTMTDDVQEDKEENVASKGDGERDNDYKEVELKSSKKRKRKEKKIESELKKKKKKTKETDNSKLVKKRKKTDETSEKERKAKHEEHLAKRRMRDKERREKKKKESAEKLDKVKQEKVEDTMQKSESSLSHEEQCAKAQRKFEKCENEILPILSGMKEASKTINEESAENCLNELKSKISIITIPFIEHYKPQLVVKDVRNTFKKSHPTMYVIAKEIFHQLKNTYNENKKNVPKGFQPVVKESISDAVAKVADVIPSRNQEENSSALAMNTSPQLVQSDANTVTIKSEDIIVRTSGTSGELTSSKKSIPEEIRSNETSASNEPSSTQKSAPEEISTPKEGAFEDHTSSKKMIKLESKSESAATSSYNTKRSANGIDPSQKSIPKKSSVTEEVLQLQPAAPTSKPPRKAFTLKGMLAGPKTPVSRTKDINNEQSSSSNKQLRRRQVPKWLTDFDTKVDSLDDDRHFALEFFADAVICFPSEQVDRSAVASSLEAAAYTWSGEGKKPKEYWEKVYDVVSAISGKDKPGTIVKMILDGYFPSPLDVVKLPRKKLHESFEGNTFD